jgi:two-component system chemotaxis response regulator CheY
MPDTPKVLIIEDDTALRQLLQEQFTQAGYVVDATAEGESGLTMAQTGGYTAILLDLQMPKVTGLEFLKQYQQTPPKNPNGPIIVISSHSQEVIKQATLDNGAAAFIQKDEEAFTKLPETVAQILQNSQSRTITSPHQSS